MLGAHPDMKGGKFTAFTTMNFVRCNAQADGAAAVAEVLRVGGPDMPNTNLLFCDCRIGERGCQALGQALGYGGNTTLKRLKLQYDETIGDRGASMLSRSLRMNGVLEVLHLEYCNIGSVGCRGISKILEYGGTQLKELSLQGNPITGIGLISIAKGLSKNAVLETLNLRDCGVGRDIEDLEGIEALKEALIVNQTLQSLQFEENFIGDEGAEIFASMEEDSKSVLSSSLSLSLSLSLPFFFFYYKKQVHCQHKTFFHFFNCVIL
jgi:Ran GTPase-activating protein (RanGAP) involved in mRNA processing and transport